MHLRFVFGLVLLALLGADRAAAFAPVVALSPQPLVLDAKFVCGQTPEGFKCRREPGAVRRSGKMHKIPGSDSKGSESSSGSWWGGSDDENAEALPPAAADGAGGGTAAGACPPNSERLGGHCIPYTQSCNRGLAANAAPQVCRSAEEKLVCEFRADGLKDCCCRTYSKF